MKKLSKKFWIIIILFSFVGQVAWVVENMYFNVYIYKIFNATSKDIAIMVGLSAIFACVTTLLIGALSDKIGKRKIFICFGYIMWGLSIISFNLIPTISGNSFRIGVSLVIIMDCVMTFFGSSANDACFNAWLTDSVDDRNRGKVEGVNSMMPLLAVLAVFGGFIGLNLDKISHWNIIYYVIGVVAILCGIVGIFLIDEPIKQKNEDNQNYLKNILYGFKLSTINENKKFYAILVFFCMFNIAIQIFMPYLILYYEKSLLMENYVVVMAPAIIISAICTVLYGKVYDKFGFDKTIWIPLFLMIIGFATLALFGKNLVFIGSTMMLAGDLMGMGIFGAKIRDLTPKNKTGLLQGVRMFSQIMIPGIIGPMIGNMVLKNATLITNNDGTKSFIPNANIFICAFIVMWLLVISLYIYLKSQKKDK